MLSCSSIDLRQSCLAMQHVWVSGGRRTLGSGSWLPEDFCSSDPEATAVLADNALWRLGLWSRYSEAHRTSSKCSWEWHRSIKDICEYITDSSVEREMSAFRTDFKSQRCKGDRQKLPFTPCNNKRTKNKSCTGVLSRFWNWTCF